MHLIPVRSLELPKESIRKSLGHDHQELCEFINKYDACIPIIINDDGAVIREIHSFLYEKHLFSRGITSKETVRTYSECLSHWLKYCSSKKIDWKISTVRSILDYRNSMKSACNGGRRSLRPSTINLRTTVVVEFYRYYLETMATNKGAAQGYLEKSIKFKTSSFMLRKSQGRPVALSSESCKRISENLRSSHRLIFIWAISTGLRLSSILSISLKDYSSIQTKASGGFISVQAKGGKWIKVFLTRHIIEETDRYVRVERNVQVVRHANGSLPNNKLFLNKNGGSVSKSCYYAAYKRCCEKLEIQSHPHQARTTFATFIERSLRNYGKENGIDHVKIVQGMLGHASSDTTMAYLESLNVVDMDVLNILENNSRELGGKIDNC